MGGPSAVEVVELVSVEARGGTVHGSDVLQPHEHREAGAAIEAGVGEEGEHPENVQELAPVDGGWHAWRFVASGFVVEVMVWGFQFSYGIFQDYYTSYPLFKDSSRVSVSAVGTLSLATQFSETLILSFFFGRYPDLLRPSLWAALALSVLSLLLASFAKEVWQLILLQGITFGIGGGFLYYPILMLLSQWFVRRRGLAAGIIFAGSGLGGFVLPFLLQAFLEHCGFRWTLRIWALAILGTVGIAIPGMRPRLPVPKYQGGQRPRFIPPQMHFLKSTLFWLLSTCNILHATSLYSVSFYIATFVKTLASPLSASIVLALFNSSGTVFQVLFGHLCDRVPYAWIMIASTLVSGLSVFLLWGFAHTVSVMLVFAIIYGGLMGGFKSAGPIAVSDCAGSKPEQASIIWACSYVARGIAVIIGPLISGMLYDARKASVEAHLGFGGYGFEALEIFAGTCAVAASLASVLVAVAGRRLHNR